ncbi:MAG TPA: hypothetical protein VLQ65_05665 [Saliniramus sp.]|nr:hypothetical protein [Saliniramus sp.]
MTPRQLRQSIEARRIGIYGELLVLSESVERLVETGRHRHPRLAHHQRAVDGARGVRCARRQVLAVEGEQRRVGAEAQAAAIRSG